MSRLFGTDGVRGVANQELTPGLAFGLGKAGAIVLTAERKHKAKIIVGTDTRISCDMLKASLISGLCSVGAEVIDVGVLPTPAIAYLIRYYQADAGVVISASHNPYEFNGIKFFDYRGYKLEDETEDKIEAYIQNNFEGVEVKIGSEIGYIIENNDARNIYEQYLTEKIGADLKGMNIVLDCANGAAYKVGPETFRKLGANVIVLHDKPDGVNINKDCGSTHLQALKQSVLDNQYDIGLAFDGDADRVLAVDNEGNLVDGDMMLGILGIDLKKKNKLNNHAIVVTVMSNIGFDIFAKENDIKVLKTKVGDRYVLEEMMKNGYVLGGEQSGHVIMLEHNTTGDGVLVGLHLVKCLKESGKRMSDLSKIMNIYPQVLVNAKVSNDKKNLYLKDAEIQKNCIELENEFKGEGRVLIRPSGTEPLVRVMIEGKDVNIIRKKAEELATLIETRLG